MDIKEYRLEDIKPYEKNPRKNDAAVQYVANSIKSFGFRVPIVIDKDNVIVCGHTRYKAAKQLGLESVPCIKADDLTPEQIKAYRLADNKTAEAAEWDIELLNEELADLLDMNMEDYGFTLETEEEQEPQEDNYDPHPPAEPKSKRGDVYELGEHRLMCGDSTDPYDVKVLMDGKMADLLLTDPPYNVDYLNGHKEVQKAVGTTYKAGGIQKGKTISDGELNDLNNDKMNDEEFTKFLTSIFTNARNNMKQGGVYYIFHPSSKEHSFLTALQNTNLKTRQTLIWNKNHSSIGRQDYRWKHEPILYGWTDGAAHYFIDDRTQKTVIEDQIPDVNSMKKAELVDLLKQIYADKISTTVINEDIVPVSDLHPTMKPIKLLARLIANSSRQGETVLDICGGSGSTMIAAEQLNRKAYLMEIDPKYVDVIIDRWEQFTGRKAKKVRSL